MQESNIFLCIKIIAYDIPKADLIAIFSVFYWLFALVANQFTHRNVFSFA